MEAFATWKAILLHDFSALKHFEGPDEESRARYVLKEQAIGQHCCQAGESLSDAELALLKRILGLSEQQWHVYKSKLWPPPKEPQR